MKIVPGHMVIQFKSAFCRCLVRTPSYSHVADDLSSIHHAVNCIFALDIVGEKYFYLFYGRHAQNVLVTFFC
jgi:hypothetical protein